MNSKPERHDVTVYRVKPPSMSGQCYVCTDPGSIAPLHIWFGQPMHTTCFLNLIAWDANRRATQMKKPRWKLKPGREAVPRMKDMVLGEIAPHTILLRQAKLAQRVLKFAAWHANHRAIPRMPTAWALCNHCSHTNPDSVNLKRLEDSVRRTVALGYVFEFQAKIREKQNRRVRCFKEKYEQILCRKILASWHQGTDDSSGPPTLQESSSENDDYVQPALSDSSSDNDTMEPLEQLILLYDEATRRL